MRSYDWGRFTKEEVLVGVLLGYWGYWVMRQQNLGVWFVQGVMGMEQHMSVRPSFSILSQ